MLVRRFSESRRPHPLLPHMPVLEGVRFEKERLSDLRKHAERIIDTSDITVHELRDRLTREFRQDSSARRMTISLVTFGYKFGVPIDIDLLFDVRFLRNPFFVPELKPLTGEDMKVQDYVLRDPAAAPFIEQLENLFKFLFPLFERDQRSYVNIGIGCTGGRHRSVTIARRLQEIFASLGHEVSVTHRDLQKSIESIHIFPLDIGPSALPTFLTGGLYQLYLPLCANRT